MSRPEWNKKARDEPIYEGIRGADFEEIGNFDIGTQNKIQTILDAMEGPQLVVFGYGDSDRIVAPFVLGISGDGNPLLRGFQLEGFSRSGKGAGWRIFQIIKMERLTNHQEFFEPEDFYFDSDYPWIYRVIKTL